VAWAWVNDSALRDAADESAVKFRDSTPRAFTVAATSNYRPWFGLTTELSGAEQFNKLLAKLEKSTTLTLQIRRGEINVFATIKGEPRG